VDIGGTKLAAGLVSESGALLTCAQVPTPRGEDGDHLFAVLGTLLDEILTPLSAETRTRVVVCGVGCGGPMTPEGETVSPLNIPAWEHFPLRRELARRTGLPVAIDNDAKALALGEGWVGAGADERNFLAMVVSTGVGGGIVLEGRLLDGATGNAGHIGHLVVEPDGRRCACGARGCLEAEASGTAIAALTGRPAAEASPAVVERTGRMVGRAVAGVAQLLDLPLALVGGSVALGFGAPFFAAANLEVARTARLAFALGATIRPVGLGVTGPLVGAGAVGWWHCGRLLLDKEVDAP
jgi:glucokinase